jgi:hypothetical protein
VLLPSVVGECVKLALNLGGGGSAVDIIRSGEQQKRFEGDYLPKVIIIVVHCRNLDNTVESVESILLSDYPNSSLLLCDNSSDASLSGDLAARIKDATKSSINVVAKSDVSKLSGASMLVSRPFFGRRRFDVGRLFPLLRRTRLGDARRRQMGLSL